MLIYNENFKGLVINEKIFVADVDEYISVDDDDYERVNFYKWHKSYAHDTHRILTQILGRKVTLPEFILNDQHGYQKIKNHDFTKMNLATDKYSFRYRKPQKKKKTAHLNLKESLTIKLTISGL
ncbi:hypothetical protein MTQ92_12090 [Staphylococcus agnetis]|uniref:hypothetical protein n=1 Tax=Staphylococcus agnetis TaxID=985762 RepID=UPI00208E5D79|nr:hypothetical protein [Staphylococcus agnetis]MCO4339798.1 hypothetical protein [Staphylococcus agnetis]